MKEEHGKPRMVKSVPIWLLITVALAFIVGLVCGLLLVNVLAGSQTSLSTTSIISLTFTVALGAASIILASITIVLSRSAEEALIRRSDEGIRLQNEAFVRTNEVLSKIEASTGVTEKRLEDVIAGRTSLIAEEAFEKSVGKGEMSLSQETEERLKKSLADSLREELIPLVSQSTSEAERRLIAMEERRERIVETNERWRVYRQAIVDELAKYDEALILSQSDGKARAETMEGFWDVVLAIGEHRAVLDIHIAEKINVLDRPNWYRDSEDTVAKNFSWRAHQDEIHTVFWVWDEDMSDRRDVAEYSQLINNGLRDTEFVVLHGDASLVASQVVSRMGRGQSAAETEAEPEGSPINE